VGFLPRTVQNSGLEAAFSSHLSLSLSQRKTMFGVKGVLSRDTFEIGSRRWPSWSVTIPQRYVPQLVTSMYRTT
jgi:hypothetical protein